jgi:peroxiredoxin
VFQAKKDSAWVIAVNIQEDNATASKFASDYGWTFPVALDQNAVAAKAYGVSGIPVTFVIDRQGKVVDSLLGAVAEQALIDALDRASR